MKQIQHYVLVACAITGDSQEQEPVYQCLDVANVTVPVVLATTAK